MEGRFNGSLYFPTTLGLRLSTEQKRNIFTIIIKLLLELIRQVTPRAQKSMCHRGTKLKFVRTRRSETDYARTYSVQTEMD